jgi:hypothetical protein
MKWWTVLPERDKRLLGISIGLLLAMVLLLAVFAPAAQQDDPVPSSYGVGNHGAKATYLTLGRLGYRLERWEGPLDELAAHTDERTTLILAEPYVMDPGAEKRQVQHVLEHGGRVLAIGLGSALLLPEGGASMYRNRFTEACKATPVGFDSVAAGGDVRMQATSYWSNMRPAVRTQYDCDQKPVVVTYAVGKGEVVWWADALPLENIGITQGDNLELLLHSVGPVAGTRVYWDESLHGEVPSLWSYAKGTPYQLVAAQLLFVAALLLLSYGRRSGPLRPDPLITRASESEFVRSLGGLFHKAHASHAAVDIAYQHLRRRLQVVLGISSSVTAEEAALALQRRVPAAGNLLEAMQAAEESARGENLPEGKALALVQQLERIEADVVRV